MYACWPADKIHWNDENSSLEFRELRNAFLLLRRLATKKRERNVCACFRKKNGFEIYLDYHYVRCVCVYVAQSYVVIVLYVYHRKRYFF